MVLSSFLFVSLCCADSSFVKMKENGDCDFMVKEDNGVTRKGTWLDLAKFVRVNPKYLPNQYKILKALGYKESLFKGNLQKNMEFRKEKLCMVNSGALDQMLGLSLGRPILGGTCDDLRALSVEMNYKLFHSSFVDERSSLTSPRSNQ